MSTRRLVVDDSDPRIRYSETAWSTTPPSEGNENLIFENSQHTIQGNGSLSFVFKGTSIDAYGTGGQVLLSSGYDPLWTCLIDNQPVNSRAPTTDTSGHLPLCSGFNLTDGMHNFTIEIAGEGVGAFFFDRVIYTPMSMVNGSDDVMWIGCGDSAFDFGNNWDTTADLKISNTHGAAVSLNFTGCGLSWIGDILGDLPGNASSCTYVIDDGDPVSVALSGHSFQNTTTVYDAIFFKTPELPLGSHIINVTYDGDYETPLTIGYVLISNATLSGPTSPMPMRPPPPPCPSSPTCSSDAQIGSQAEPHPVGSIAGGIVGGVLIVAVIVIILIIRRRRRDLGDSDSENSLATLNSHPLECGDRIPQNSTATSTISQPSSAAPPDSSGLHRTPRNRSAQNVGTPPPYVSGS